MLAKFSLRLTVFAMVITVTGLLKAASPAERMVGKFMFWCGLGMFGLAVVVLALSFLQNIFGDSEDET